MPQTIKLNLSDSLVQTSDSVAKDLRCSRADFICMAIEMYIEEHDDLSIILDRLRDQSDPVLDWEEVKDELLEKDCKKEEQPNH